MRMIVEASGTTWTIWEVRPGMARLGEVDRRARDRRRDPAPDPIVERRMAADRRRAAEERVAGISGDLATGWLAIEVAGERRRLAPIPIGWTALPDAVLLALCRRAPRAPARSADGPTPVAPPAGD